MSEAEKFLAPFERSSGTIVFEAKARKSLWQGPNSHTVGEATGNAQVMTRESPWGKQEYKPIWR